MMPSLPAIDTSASSIGSKYALLIWILLGCYKIEHPSRCSGLVCNQIWRESTPRNPLEHICSSSFLRRGSHLLLHESRQSLIIRPCQLPAGVVLRRLIFSSPLNLRETHLNIVSEVAFGSISIDRQQYGLGTATAASQRLHKGDKLVGQCEGHWPRRDAASATMIRNQKDAIRRWSFVLLNTIAVIGATTGSFAIPILAVEDGSSSHNGLSVGILVLVGQAFTVMALPLTSSVAAWFGVTRGLVFVKICVVTTNALVAVFLLVGASPFPVLVVGCAALGLMNGWSLTLGQMVMATFFSAQDRARSASILVASVAVAWIVGASAAYLIVAAFGAIVALLITAATALPVAAFLMIIKPPHAVGLIIPQGNPFRALYSSVKSDAYLRVIYAVLFAGMLTVGPLGQLLVPVACGICGVQPVDASLFLIAIAIGSIFVPLVVRLVRNLPPTLVGYVGFLISGALAISIGLAFDFSDGWLSVWTLAILLALFGLCEGTVLSVYVVAVQANCDDSARTVRISIFYLAVFLGAGVGALIWGYLIDTVGAAADLKIAGTAAIVLLLLLAPAVRRNRSALPPVY